MCVLLLLSKQAFIKIKNKNKSKQSIEYLLFGEQLAIIKDSMY